MKFSGITHIAFDADDTLWGHENVFVEAREKCLAWLRGCSEQEVPAEEVFYRIEAENLGHFGYGVKGFVLSMIETAISLSAGKVSGAEIEKIIRLGKEMLAHPIELLPFVYEAVDALEDHYHLLIVTKGDLFDQENKIARSGLADRFRTVEIVSEKSTATYTDILRRHAIPPERFLMIGNSLKSDVLPVVAAGGRAVYLPYAFTWRQEQVAVAETNEHWCTAESMEWIVAQLMAAGTGRVFR